MAAAIKAASPQAVSAASRPATPADAAALADLVNFAGEGLPFYLWSGMAAPGQSPWDVGRQRARRDEGGFSWHNAVVRVQAERVVAALIGYALPDLPQGCDDDMPAMFVPLQQLEDLAAGSWYVNVLAAYPDARGRGHGSALMAVAEQRAELEGCNGLSIIVSDANHGARRLYERCGYRERASRPMVKERWRNPGANWVLLTKGTG